MDNWSICLYTSVNSSCAQYPLPPPPRLLWGICLPCHSHQGWGICKFCAAWGPRICQSLGHSRAFDMHAISNQNITTQKILLGKKQIGSFVKDEEGCEGSRFYVCISSLPIKPELHSRIWSYWSESTFFWFLSQISVDIIWKISFHIYKTIHNI